jgi:hypothetical protein
MSPRTRQQRRRKFWPSSSSQEQRRWKDREFSGKILKVVGDPGPWRQQALLALLVSISRADQAYGSMNQSSVCQNPRTPLFFNESEFSILVPPRVGGTHVPGKAVAAPNHHILGKARMDLVEDLIRRRPVVPTSGMARLSARCCAGSQRVFGQVRRAPCPLPTAWQSPAPSPASLTAA